jgi:hypothetical protein
MPGRVVYLFATFFGISFGVLRLLSTSGYQWIRDGVAPYLPLEYPFLFGAVFLSVYGWTDMPRLALIFGLFLTVGFWIIASGVI